MKKIIASLVAAAAVVLPAHSDPIKEDEYFTPHAHGVYVTSRVYTMFKNLKQFLTSTNMRILILITVLLLMSSTLSSDHLMRSELKFF